MCRRSARSSGQVGRIVYKPRALGNSRMAGIGAGHTKLIDVALRGNGQHCNEHSIIIELNSKTSPRSLFSL